MRARQLKPTIICITESWLSPEIPDSAIDIEGYRVHRHDRNSHGGGIVCYLRTFLQSVSSIESVDDDASLVATEFLSMLVKDIPVLIVIIYHPFWDNNVAHEGAISWIKAF